MDLQNVLVESEEVFLLRGEGHCGERLLWVVEKIDGGKETFFFVLLRAYLFPLIQARRWNSLRYKANSV